MGEELAVGTSDLGSPSSSALTYVFGKFPSISMSAK